LPRVRVATTRVLAVAALLVTLAACEGDDGRAVRNYASSDATTSSGSPVGAAQAATQLAGGLVDYRDDVVAGIDASIAGVAELRAALRAGDRAGARAAYGPSRAGWALARPLAGLYPELQAAIDGAADATTATTGWPALERALFDDDPAVDAEAAATRLSDDLETLRSRLVAAHVTVRQLANGMASASRALAQRAEGDASASRADWWDVVRGVAGLRLAYRALQPALVADNGDLVALIDARFAALDAQLESVEDGDGYLPYPDAPDSTTTAVQRELDQLARRLSVVPTALGVG
jgi:iron uptake system component EfeO